MLKRRWFQIHLSTSIIAMLAAALLLWANIYPSIVRGPTFEDRSYGWPQEFYWQGKVTSDYASPIGTPQEDSLWRWSTLLSDAILGTGILILVTSTVELIVRRIFTAELEDEKDNAVGP